MKAIYVDYQLHRQLKTEAAAEGISLSGYVERILNRRDDNLEIKTDRDEPVVSERIVPNEVTNEVAMPEKEYIPSIRDILDRADTRGEKDEIKT